MDLGRSDPNPELGSPILSRGGYARTRFLSPTRSSPARVALARAENLASAALWRGEEAVDET